MRRRRFAWLIAGVMTCGMLAPLPIGAADGPPEIPLLIEKNQFQPADVKVKAGAPFILVITNRNAAAAEFESKELRVEKVIPAGKTVKVRMRALKPGTYPFVDDFHAQTTGRIIAE